MAQNKTQFTSEDVYAFIDSFASTEQKRRDSLELVQFFQNLINEKPQMYGPSIIGFGRYDYKYKSGHEGNAPILAFSPRKSAITLYVYSDSEKNSKLLGELGKCKVTKGCIYIQKLSDIRMEILVEICKETIRIINQNYPGKND